MEILGEIVPEWVRRNNDGGPIWDGEEEEHGGGIGGGRSLDGKGKRGQERK